MEPVPEPQWMQTLTYYEFRFRIFTTDTRHHAAAVFRGHHIRHAPPVSSFLVYLYLPFSRLLWMHYFLLMNSEWLPDGTLLLVPDLIRGSLRSPR